MKATRSVEEYIENKKEWKEEIKYLRAILQSTELEECIKWGASTYTYKGKNIISLGTFESYLRIWFFQGALLKDKEKTLINAQEGKTCANSGFNPLMR